MLEKRRNENHCQLSSGSDAMCSLIQSFPTITRAQLINIVSDMPLLLEPLS